MRKLKTGSWLLGSLAAVLSIGAANLALAQETEERPPIAPPETIQEEDTAQPETAQPNVDRQADLRNGFMGEFTSQHQGMITVTREGETPRMFRMAEDTKVTLNGRPAELQALRKGDRIRVIQGVDGVILRLEASRQADGAPNTVQRRQAGFRGPAQEAQETDQGERATQDNRREQTGDAWLGVMLRDGEGEQGVEIVRTYPSGPASRAGLYSGDVLLQINNKDVSSPQDANRILEQLQPREQVEIVVMRGEEQQTVTATLGDRRAFLGGDPRREGRREFRQEGGFDGGNIGEHAMMLEQHRRLAEQHQRIEEKLDQVLQELEELRQQMGGQRRQPVAPANGAPTEE